MPAQSWEGRPEANDGDCAPPTGQGFETYFEGTWNAGVREFLIWLLGPAGTGPPDSKSAEADGAQGMQVSVNVAQDDLMPFPGVA